MFAELLSCNSYYNNDLLVALNCDHGTLIEGLLETEFQ